MATDLARNISHLMTLPPDQIYASCIFLAALIFLNDLIRTALMVEYTRSVINHVIIDILTLLPAIFIGVVLLYAGHGYPGRVWINLALAAGLYIAWYAGGQITVLARKDTEAADIGWMAMGALITIPCGLLAILLSWVF